MQSRKLLDSVVELHTTLETTPNIDDSILEHARDLDSKMHQMMESNELKAEESITDQLLELEAQFAAEHPVLERLTREVIDRLSQMGI